MAKMFFVAWDLWQQMTFVLACAIVVVFCAGLVKLWHTNRILKKHMVFDAEKQARQREMRKSGLSIGRKADIPFGVRAIQTGVEVDGIWISRPGTPTESDDLGAAMLIGSVSDIKAKDKPSPVAGGLRKPTTAVIEVEPTPNQSPAPSLLERSDAYTPNPRRTTQPGPQPTYRPTQSPNHPLAASTEATHTASFEQVEAAARSPRLETYIPTSPYPGERNAAYTPLRRSSGSFEDDYYTYEDPAPPASRYQDRPVVFPPPPRRRSPPVEVSETVTPTPIADFMQRDGGYFAHLEAPVENRRNPFDRGSAVETGAERSRDSQTLGHRVHPSHGSTDSQVPPPPPQRSYSGGTHVNTSSRRVNAGFEVLPAGTFSSRPQSQGGDGESTTSNRSRNRIPPVTNRLQKRGHDRP